MKEMNFAGFNKSLYARTYKRQKLAVSQKYFVARTTLYA